MAASVSLVASLISARVMISLRTVRRARYLVDRNLAGFAFRSVTRPTASGATICTASRAARGRFASVAMRAFFQTSSGARFLLPTRRSAAEVQPSSASRWAYQFLRTSSDRRASSTGFFR